MVSPSSPFQHHRYSPPPSCWLHLKHINQRGTREIIKHKYGNYLKHCCFMRNTVKLKKRVLRVAGSQTWPNLLKTFLSKMCTNFELDFCTPIEFCRIWGPGLKLDGVKENWFCPTIVMKLKIKDQPTAGMIFSLQKVFFFSIAHCRQVCKKPIASSCYCLFTVVGFFLNSIRKGDLKS